MFSKSKLFLYLILFFVIVTSILLYKNFANYGDNINYSRVASLIAGTKQVSLILRIEYTQLNCKVCSESIFDLVDRLNSIKNRTVKYYFLINNPKWDEKQKKRWLTNFFSIHFTYLKNDGYFLNSLQESIILLYKDNKLIYKYTFPLKPNSFNKIIQFIMSPH